MKSFLLALLPALALGLAFAPTAARASYQPADVALEKLENIVTLTPAQEKQALQIFQDLKDIMDSMTPEERIKQGTQSRKDAIAAICSILTPAQQAIYDRTPQRLGGAGKAGDPDRDALAARIRLFLRDYVRNSADIAATIGPVQRIVQSGAGANTTTSSPGGNLHPDSGTNLVRVTGSSGTKTFEIAWSMDESGAMTVTGIKLK